MWSWFSDIKIDMVDQICLNAYVISFSNLTYYQKWIGNKFENKLSQLLARCVTNVTRILVMLFRFIN